MKSSSSLFSKTVIAVCVLLIGTIGLVTYLYFTNEGVANEFRQIRQPKPNKFFMGIDVSATINPETLKDINETLIARLSNFIGDPAVSYEVESFGNPGCGLKSVNPIVSTSSPEDSVTFKYEVENKIRGIKVARVDARSIDPLTTPIYAFLQKILKNRSGGRIIIFSDLMNDDSDCKKQYYFPVEEIEQFGKNRNGQIIFLYPTPALTDREDLNEKKLQDQKEFINQMETLRSEGKVRVFFYHIPDDEMEQLEFIESKLRGAIPATTFEVVLERASKMVDTIVSAVRG